MIVGRIITPRTMRRGQHREARTAGVRLMKGARTMTPMKPKTTEGMPARSSMAGFTMRMQRRSAELGEEDRPGDAQGRPDEERAEGDPERGDDHREDAIVARVGPPIRREEKVAQAHLEEEWQAFLEDEGSYDEKAEDGGTGDREKDFRGGFIACRRHLAPYRDDDAPRDICAGSRPSALIDAWPSGPEHKIDESLGHCLRARRA